ncbi:MAG: AmmeMemoRadiSam system protein A [Erysipelotrichaceae bacterium]|jgi:AmmeMemoRadiSam system protein A/AmmeMemoRadiSam system protein B|nr:AmmeMemoRadiSam system protein A [Erysipelotrichaceae bacterium]
MIVRAVMEPHPPVAVKEIGRGEEKKIEKTLASYHEASKFIAACHPDTVIITSPHATMYSDYFMISSGKRAYGDFANYHAPQVSFDIPYDEELTCELNAYLKRINFPGGTEYDRDRMLDQGTMVPLYFLLQEMPHVRIVRIGISGLPLTKHYELGMHIAAVAEKLGRRIAWIASGDLAHCEKEDGPYGYHPEGPQYDQRIMKDMGKAEFMNLLAYDPAFLEKAMECGHRSFCILAGALDRTAVTSKVLSHEATLGVGYGFVEYTANGKDDSRNFLDQFREKEEQKIEAQKKKEDPYVQLARRSLETYIREHHRIHVPEDLPAEMLQQKAGVFVSIHENGELRGCIGTICPTQMNIAAEIIANAISASTRDPRFTPIEEKELPYLHISADVLGEIENISSPKELDVRRYGVICSKGDRRGLLLPNLEGVDTVEEQIRIACHKGDIDPEEEGIQMQRFEVVRHV